MHWKEFKTSSAADNRIAVLGEDAETQPFVEMFEAGIRALELPLSVASVQVEGSEFKECIEVLSGHGFVGAYVASGPLKVDAARVAERFFVSQGAVGVANTLKFEGGVYALNTEVAGMMEVVRDIPPATALVLGTGHAARSVVAALLQAGWKVRLWNRNALRSRPLKAMMLRWGEVRVQSNADPAGCRLVVNATSLGTRAGEHPPVLWAHAPLGTVALDLVYRRVATEFLREAGRRGFRTIDGRVLLAEQAATSLEWLTGREVPREAVRGALGVRE